MITGIEATGEVPGLRSVASTQIAPASASSRAGARVLGVHQLGARQQHRGASRSAASGATSSGWISERWSTERAPHSSATGTERCVESCSTCARSGAAGVARDRAHPRQVLVGERDRLDEDVERVDVALARQRLGLVHPRVRRRAGRDRVREQPGQAHRLHDARRQLAPQPRGARLAVAREPVAGLALERGRAVREQLARERGGLGEHLLVRGLGERPRGAGDPAARARDLLVRHARSPCARTPPRASRRTAGACGSRRSPGSTAQPDASTTTSASRGLEAGDPPAVEQHVAGLERQLARAVVAQVGQPVLGRAQHLRGAADRDAGHLPRASGSSPASPRHRDVHPEPLGGLDRLVVAGVDVAHDPHARVGQQRAPDPLARRARSRPRR